MDPVMPLKGTTTSRDLYEAVKKLFFFCCSSSATVSVRYILCGPKQLVFFQHGPGELKAWTPLHCTIV